MARRSPLAVRLRHAVIGQGPSWRGALGALVLRNVRGTIAGLVCAWYNVPFIVFVAGLGAVGGGLAGVVSGTFAGVGVMARIDAFFRFVFPLGVGVKDLLPTAAAQIGGIVGGILGALNGAWEMAWRAAVWPWMWLYDTDPMWPAAVALGQIIVALFVATLYVVWSSLTESGRLRVSGARRMSRREAE